MGMDQSQRQADCFGRAPGTALMSFNIVLAEMTSERFQNTLPLVYYYEKVGH